MRRCAPVLLLALVACVPAPAATPAPAAPARMATEVHWFRNSAEQRALYRQTYRWAEERLREMVRGQPAGWAVIADADETLLDNSTYQRRQTERGGVYDAALWNAWVRERAAPALPGATGFVNAVHALGGRVVVVTNRDQEVCDDTRANLATVGIQADAVLCKGESSDKNPRFQAVAAGTAAPGLPALRVVMWVGDNIQDFPGLTQEVRNGPPAAFDRFGSSYVVLPNPMYGSWERNPPM